MDVNLILFKKNGSQKSFPLPSNLTVIGRRRDCDLVVPLMKVSRRHCQLDLSENELKIRDLGSRNGTFLNGQRVNGDATAKPGDYLQIGPLVFQLQIDGNPPQAAPPPPTKPKPTDKEPLLTADDDEDEEFDFSDLDIEDSGDSFLDELEEL